MTNTSISMASPAVKPPNATAKGSRKIASTSKIRKTMA